MPLYCGVDLHARQQTLCYCDRSEGETHYRALRHDADDLRSFYAQFQGEVIVGLEASGYSTWFIALLERLGHQVGLGAATEIRRRARRRQKNDRRDAGLFLDLLLRAACARVQRPAFESRELLRLLRYGHRLVQMRTQGKNSLQALVYSAGAATRAKLLSQQGRERLLQLPMSEAMARQRNEWLPLVAAFDARVTSLAAWRDQPARRDERVLRLQTHPGVGLLSSLALVHTLAPVTGCSGSRQVAADAGLAPLEYASGEKPRFGASSKGGARLLRYLLVEAAQTTVRRDAGLKRC